MLPHLKVLDDDVILVKRLKKSLLNNFKLTGNNDVDKALVLSNYFFCLGKVGEAKDLLDAFIFSVECGERRDLWNTVGHGIILRSYIEENSSLKEQILRSVLDDDIMTDRCSHYELYLE